MEEKTINNAICTSFLRQLKMGEATTGNDVCSMRQSHGNWNVAGYSVFKSVESLFAVKSKTWNQAKETINILKNFIKDATKIFTADIDEI